MTSINIYQLLGVYNVADFGLERRPSADNAGPVQAALDAARLAGGGVVVIPPDAGVVGIGRALRIGDYTELVIPTGVTLKALPSFVSTYLIGNHSFSGGNTGCRIGGGGRLDGSRPTVYAIGIDFRKVDRPGLRDLAVADCDLHGIRLLESSYGTLVNVEAARSGANGIQLNNCHRWRVANAAAIDNCLSELPGNADGISLFGGSSRNVITGPLGDDSKPAPLAAPTAPTAALASPAAPGNLSAGNYTYRLTYVTVHGETQGGTVSSPAVTVLDPGVNGQIDLSSIPVGPAGTIARRLYRTTAGGAVYKRVTELDNVATTYRDNIADAALGADAPTVNTSGKRQGYGVRESAGCDHNIVVGGALTGNLTGAVLLAGANSRYIAGA